MTSRPRGFPAIHWENLALAEAADRRAEYSQYVRQVTPQLAQQLADLSFAYPDLPGGVVTGMAQAGVPPFSPEADQIRDRNAELRAAGLSAVDQKQGFWDVGLGRGIKGFTRGAFTFFQSLYDEGIKGTTAFLTGIGQGKDIGEAFHSSFGFSPGALAIANLQQGRPVNLGSGWFAGGDLSEETQAALDRGVPLREAIANEKQLEMGLPLQQFSEAWMAEDFQKVPGTENVVDERTGQRGLTVTPGRIAASTILEPGTNAYNNVSGVLDFGSNIFLDPANVLGAGVAKVRKANRALTGLVDGPRSTVIARNVDEWLASRHGDTVARFIAGNQDYLTLHGLFRKNAVRSNVDANFIRNLVDEQDVGQVKEMISTLARGGYGSAGQLRELPVRQSLLGRAFGTSGLAGVFARGLGRGGGAVDVLGLRHAIKANRQSTSFLGRMAAEVGATSLRMDDVDQAVDDFGQWMQAAGFKPNKISEFMGDLAEIQPGQYDTMPAMWGVVQRAYRHLGEEMIADGIPKPVAKAFTRVFDSVDSHRQFWLNNAGHAQHFAGGRYHIMVDGQVRAIPTAHLFSEFMDNAIPLLDMRKVRQGLRRSFWAKHGAGELAGKRLKGGRQPEQIFTRFRLEDMDKWEDLGPSVLGKLVNDAVQKVWKPLVLLRIAWPVRVIAEEQVRMLGVGLDGMWNHPLHALAISTGRSLSRDVLGEAFEDARQFQRAMSRRGMHLGLGSTTRQLYTDEWHAVSQADPRYWEAWAIELQQLADDPITARIARDLVENPDVKPADVLRRIKDEFLDPSTELGKARSALAADSRNWKIVRFDEIADKVIDDRYARLAHKGGGDYVIADYLRGTWEDSFGTDLVWDKQLGRYMTPDGSLGYKLDPPLPKRGDLEAKIMPIALNRMHDRLTPVITRAKANQPMFENVDDALDLADDLDELDAVFQAVSNELSPARADAWLQGDIYSYHGFNPKEMAARLRRDPEAFVFGERGVYDRMLQDIEGLRRGLIQVRDEAFRVADPSGRASTRAVDMIQMAGNPKQLEDLFSGYNPLPGQLSKDELVAKIAANAWTPKEVVDAIGPNHAPLGRYGVKAIDPQTAPEVYARAKAEGHAIWTAPFDPDNPAKGEIVYIGNYDEVSDAVWETGQISLRRDPNTGRVTNVELFQTARKNERTIWYDPDMQEHVQYREEMRPYIEAAARMDDDQLIQGFADDIQQIYRADAADAFEGVDAGVFDAAEVIPVELMERGLEPAEIARRVADRVPDSFLTELGLDRDEIFRDLLDDIDWYRRHRDQLKFSTQRRQLQGIPETGDVPGGQRLDAGRLLAYIVDPESGLNVNPEDVYELAFGGVPIRDWLTSAGHGDRLAPRAVERVVEVPADDLVYHMTDPTSAKGIQEAGFRQGGAYGTLEEAKQWLTEPGDRAVVFRRSDLDPEGVTGPGDTIWNFETGGTMPEPLAVLTPDSNPQIVDGQLRYSTLGPPEPALSINDIAEFMRVQYGASWAGKGGPLGTMPAISLTNDGATALAKTLLRQGRGDMSRMFSGADSMGAPAWPQAHQMAHVVRSPRTELLEAVAYGKIGDLTLSTADVLDEVEKVSRISDVGRYLSENYADVMDELPQYAKVARPADKKRLDTALDHIFDVVGSRPTNYLSRNPTFKQFYWSRMAELMPYMDSATLQKALEGARAAGVGRGDLRAMVRSIISKRGVTETALERMADDFVKGRFKAMTGDITDLAQADEVAKAFALQETKRLLYDLQKRTQFFDITRNIFPFGEAWYEIVSTWMRIINENPRLIRRLQQGLEGARQEGIFYNDPGTGEEVFAMPYLDWLAGAMGVSGGDESATPTFTGRVEGVNLALNNFLPGVGPLVQMPAANFARDLFDKPELRWARDLIFPYGYPDAENPGAIVNSIMPAWFRKGLTAIGKPTGDDQRLYNNTVIDVLRAMELNGEIDPSATPAQRAEYLEEARDRARSIYVLRTLQQFVGPTGAQVRWDVELDPSGEAFAYQVLATEYRQILEENQGDRTQAVFAFINEFGFNPAGIITAKTEQVRPRSVTEVGLDFQQQNPEIFRDFDLTAYYVAPDPPDGEFNYSAYLAQLRSGDRVPNTPEQWWTERNRLLGSIAYEKARRAAVAQGIRNEPQVRAYLRALRYQLMQEYPGYGFENIGVVAQPEQRQFMAEFDRWREDPRMVATNAGQGLVQYLQQRDRALELAAREWGVSEEGFAEAKSTFQLRQYLLNTGYTLARQYPDFATIFQRHYLWEVEDPEPVLAGEVAGVDLFATEA